MLKFEKRIPPYLRKDGAVVRTVGQLLEELLKLPPNLPLAGDMCSGAYRISVTRIMGVDEDRLACEIDGESDEE
jgi:hypothetical protein